MIKKTELILILIIVPLLGCSSRFYVPRAVNLHPDTVKIADVDLYKTVSIENHQKDNYKLIGQYRHRWTANLRKWTNTAIELLSSELDRLGTRTIDDAEKKLVLSVVDPQLYWEADRIGCGVTLEIDTAGGYQNSYSGVIFSNTLYDSCDLAIKSVVTDMLNDSQVIEYLRIPRDSDRDGVPDTDDKCSKTPDHVEVDGHGCPPDSDQDSVPDYLDDCLDTPVGVSVEPTGCPPDSDQDKVPDYLDDCLDTPVGVSVEPTGCPPDGDQDKVPDYLDDCLDTPVGVSVEPTGCPPDSDQDSVPDYLDNCPDTPAGVSVESKGCPLDSDQDEIPDHLDDCPDTPVGVSVESTGCPIDNDNDGVFDYLDKCLCTPANVSVDANGCGGKLGGVFIDEPECGYKSQIVLFPDPDGKVGNLEISSLTGSKTLTKSWESTESKSIQEVPTAPVELDEDQVREMFKEALEIQPLPPKTFFLYFESGTTRLTPESASRLEAINAMIRANTLKDFTLIGHTDRSGARELNQRLSHERATTIYSLLVKEGIIPQNIEVFSFGETKPPIETPDGIDEPKNRCVEVIAR